MSPYDPNLFAAVLDTIIMLHKSQRSKPCIARVRNRAAYQTRCVIHYLLLRKVSLKLPLSPLPRVSIVLTLLSSLLITWPTYFILPVIPLGNLDEQSSQSLLEHCAKRLSLSAMAGQGFRYHDDQILVSIFGKQVFLRRHTIKKYLPQLYEQARWEISTGYLHPERYIDLDTSWDQDAIDIVFKYLKQLDLHEGTSALLQTKLDTVWRNSSRNQKQTEQFFDSLCYVFSRFGCDRDMSHVMASFFERHCAEIVQRSSKGWLKYIQGLDRIDRHDMAGMTGALSSLLRHKRSINTQFVAYLVTRGALSQALAVKLWTLIDERKRQNIGDSRPWDSRGEIVGSLGVRRGGESVCGADVDPDLLHEMAEYEPHKLWIYPDRRSRRRLHDDGISAYGLESVECSGCDPTSPFHSDRLDRVPRILPPIGDASMDPFIEQFDRGLRVPGMPVI